MIHRVETPLAGLPFIIEPGRMAKQAHGAVLVSHGDTQVLVATTLGPARNTPFDDDFIPLTVDYRERTAAAGKFPRQLQKEGIFHKGGYERDYVTSGALAALQ